MCLEDPGKKSCDVIDAKLWASYLDPIALAVSSLASSKRTFLLASFPCGLEAKQACIGGKVGFGGCDPG